MDETEIPEDDETDEAETPEEDKTDEAETSENEAGEADSTSSPQTGDDSSIALWIAFILAAVAGLTGTILYGRKRKYNR